MLRAWNGADSLCCPKGGVIEQVNAADVEEDNPRNGAKRSASGGKEHRFGRNRFLMGCWTRMSGEEAIASMVRKPQRQETCREQGHW
jgi:hypothetical protein